jgi:uncharacterized protein (TIGR00645 family)
MGKIDSTGLKLKLIASIVAISSVEVLKLFLNIENTPDREIYFMVGIHLVFVTSGVMLAWMENISTKTEAIAHTLDHHPPA